jgi:hypothetical protein
LYTLHFDRVSEIYAEVRRLNFGVVSVVNDLVQRS